VTKKKKPAAKKKPDTVAAAAVAARKAAFIQGLTQVGTISGAAQLAQIHRSTHYEWMACNDKGDPVDPAYVNAVEDALQQFADRIRHEVARRALQGVKRDVWYKGAVVGQEVEYSDRMLELIARAKCPEFKEKFEVAGAGGGPVAIQVITAVPQSEAN